MIPFDAGLCLVLAAFALVTAIARAGYRLSAGRATPPPVAVADRSPAVGEPPPTGYVFAHA